MTGPEARFPLTTEQGPKNAETREGKPRPDVIFNFIRHGTTAYGEAVSRKLHELGQDAESFTLMPQLDQSITDEREQIEGRITPEGEIGLREAAKELAGRIDTEHEIVAIVHGLRTRHEQSAAIIADELQKAGINIVRSRPHKNLSDVAGSGWLTFVEYVLKHQGKEEADLEQFWWDMYRDPDVRADMKEKGFESLEGVNERVEHFVNLGKRFVKKYPLGKTLRLISVTSDLNIEQIMQRGVPMEQRDQIWVKNAEIFELKEWNEAPADRHEG